MRRFRFRLERLLEIRRYRERQAELALAAATARCIELRRRMAEARERMAAQLVERAAAGGRLDLEALQWSEAYRRRLADLYAAAARDLVIRDKERGEAQSVYIDRSRERKVLDKLRERRQAAWKREESARDARTLDDVSQAARAGRLGGE